MEQDLKFPNINIDYLRMYKNEFLELNNLKIGDEIIWNFKYDTLRGRYKSREMDKFSAYEKSKGILKEDDNGVLFVESIKDYNFYNYTSNGLTGRSRKSWYQLEKKKAMNYFGTGYVSRFHNE